MPQIPPDAERVYIRIGRGYEQADKLTRLKNLLQLHQGPLSVVLYYEATRKKLALSDPYKVKPSPVLFKMIESIMGQDSVKAK
jgi:DNA polymerase-3 subunit alpha